MNKLILLSCLLLIVVAVAAQVADPLDQFPSREVEISDYDVMDTPVGQQVRAINDEMRKIAREADGLSKDSPDYAARVEEHRNLQLQQQSVGKPIVGLRGLQVVLYGAKAIQNEDAVKQEVMRVYSREYAPYRRGDRPNPIQNNTLYAYYEKGSDRIIVSLNKPDPTYLDVPQGSNRTSLVTITRQDIRKSAVWKEYVDDLEQRMETLARDAEPHRGTESYDLLMAGLAELKAKRDKQIKWFQGIEGINLILYGEEAIANQPAFVTQAIYDLATSKEGASIVVNNTVYGWYHVEDQQNVPWIDFMPPQPKDIRPYNGNSAQGIHSEQGIAD